MRHLGREAAISRTKVQRLIDDGRVTLDNRAATRAARRVGAGRTVTVIGDAVPATRVIAPSEMPISVLHEDDDLLVVDKPAGLVVHPTFGHAEGTLMNALMFHARLWRQGRPSLVQRLDKHTSGVLIVAKSSEMHALLVTALKRTDADKMYLALCYGRLPRAFRRVRHPLGPDPRDRRRMIVRADGADAETEVYRLGNSQQPARGLTLACCRLVTGRTHQIRAHLKAEGVPLVGDPVYGSEGWTQIRDNSLGARLRDLGRQALHAWQVTFIHPRTGRRIHVTAPVPRDLTDLLASAGLDLALEGYTEAIQRRLPTVR